MISDDDVRFTACRWMVVDLVVDVVVLVVVVVIVVVVVVRTEI